VVAQRGEEREGGGEGRNRGEVRGEGVEGEAVLGAREEERRGEETAGGGDVARGDEAREERGDRVQVRWGEGFGRGLGLRQRGGANAAEGAGERRREADWHAEQHRLLGSAPSGSGNDFAGARAAVRWMSDVSDRGGRHYLSLAFV